MNFRKKRSQITVEYLLVLGLVILVLSVIFSRRNSTLQRGVDDMVNGSKDMIIQMIDNSS